MDSSWDGVEVGESERGVECIHTLVHGRRDAWEIDRSVSLLISVFCYIPSVSLLEIPTCQERIAWSNGLDEESHDCQSHTGLGLQIALPINLQHPHSDPPMR
jgi:hypothetical protein